MATTDKHHSAAIGASRGTPFVVQTRATPTPGPNQVLIEVKAVALNPVDYIMRDSGFQVKKFPVVLGSDVGGIVSQIGSGVTSCQVGDRVTAFAMSFGEGGAPDFGAFQQFVLIPEDNVTVLPKEMSFKEAAMFPLAIYTTAAGYFHILNVPREGYKPEDKKAMLVWGAGGSIGTFAVQMAKQLGFTVYATASASHHAYLTTLGAHKCFDYKDVGVVDAVVAAVKADGFVLDRGYLATGDVSPIAAAVGQFNIPGAKIASAPFSFKMLWWKVYNWSGVAVEFVTAPEDLEKRTEFFHFVYTVWLKEKLDKKLLVASPKMEEVAGGLGGIQAALDKLKGGVSGIKLVVEL
ncbi:hypothetical protein HDU98_001927 [Podochytrium sp. JEL0797]|nr:hypothetical protein HDU98_001927 [Podochytrium sp. JEL0797]